MIKIARTFVGANSDILKNLIAHYNAYCVCRVKPSRRYVMMFGDNWCAMFASVVADLAGLEWFPYEVSVGQMVELAKYEGRYKEHSPKVGDLVIYDWDGRGWPDHVGIVEHVNSDEIIAIEGNYSNTVKRRKVGRGSHNIAGYIDL